MELSITMPRSPMAAPLIIYLTKIMSQYRHVRRAERLKKIQTSSQSFLNLSSKPNRSFLSFLLPLYQNKSKCETNHMKTSSNYRFIFMQIKIIFALRLVLKQRHKVTWKWPIPNQQYWGTSKLQSRWKHSFLSPVWASRFCGDVRLLCKNCMAHVWF